MTRHGIAPPPAEGTPPSATIPIASVTPMDVTRYIAAATPDLHSRAGRLTGIPIAPPKPLPGAYRTTADISLTAKSP